MVTLTLADRSRGWLGDVETCEGTCEGTCEQARRHHDGLAAGGHYSSLAANRHHVALSPLGQLIADKWRELAVNWPGVEVGELVVMPDHLHGILKLTRRQSHPLGQIVGSFKARSTSAARELAREPASKLTGTMPPRVPPSLLGGSSLWSPGLVDSILWSAERYQRAQAYIADNPRRLAAKRANPHLFAIRRDLAVSLPLGDDGAELLAHFSAIGNDTLLKRIDFHQVQCSRRYFAYAKDKWGKPLKDNPPAVETEEFGIIADDALASAQAGAVIVNPCISQGEREIARRAFAQGVPMIVLRNKGFSPLFKPEGAFFDRCVAGGILMLAPLAWPYVPGNKPMSREDACTLNRLAQAIARDGAAEIDYKGRTPILIGEAARAAVGCDGALSSSGHNTE